MKRNLFLIIILLAALTGCKKDVPSEYLHITYQTKAGAADTTTINIEGNTALIQSNVTPVVASQDGGTVSTATGEINGSNAVIKLATGKGSTGLMYVTWKYQDGRVVSIPFMKSDKNLTFNY